MGGDQVDERVRPQPAKQARQDADVWWLEQRLPGRYSAEDTEYLAANAVWYRERLAGPGDGRRRNMGAVLADRGLPLLGEVILPGRLEQGGHIRGDGGRLQDNGTAQFQRRHRLVETAIGQAPRG